MIMDEELRELFAQESQEHLEALEGGILQLEKTPDDQETRESVMREAHSLKGAARMLDLTEIELLSHKIESVLREQLNAASEFDTTTSSMLLQAIDGLRDLCKSALKENAPEVDVKALIASFDNTDDQDVDIPATPADKTQASKSEQPRPESIGDQAEPKGTDDERPPSATPSTKNTGKGAVSSVAAEKAESVAIVEAEKYRIETLRVKPERLDFLMNQVGELSVIQKRIESRQRTLEEIDVVWERLVRDFRSLLRRISAEEKAQNSKSDLDLDFMTKSIERLDPIIGDFTAGSAGDSGRLGQISGRIDEGVRKMRLLPLSILFEQFRRMVRDISHALGKEVDFDIDGGDVLVDKRIIEEIKDPLMHLLRNALNHGIELPSERSEAGKAEKGRIAVRGIQTATDVLIEVEDDGKGLDLDKIANKAIKLGLYSESDIKEMSPEQLRMLIFRSGLSTQDFITDISGRGVGLDVVRANVEGLKGELQVLSETGQGTSVRMHLPQRFATTDVVLVSVRQSIFGIPVENVHSVMMIQPEAMYEMEGCATFDIEGQPVSMTFASDLLELPERGKALIDNRKIPCVVIQYEDSQFGFLVDDVIEQQEIVMKPPGALLRRVNKVEGVGILGTGEICTILSPRDLTQSFSGTRGPASRDLAEETSVVRLLLVEDSMITRAQEKRILEDAGYNVTVAVDGSDGWNKLQEGIFDAVVSDIVMPKMNGFELTEKIRSDRKYADLPVILVTSLSSNEDRKKGLEAGASAYITKGGFDRNLLTETVGRLTGMPA